MSGLTPEQRVHRNLAWGVTWLAYATYYTGRKGFSAAKNAMSTQLGLSESVLGAIDTVYLTAYAAGQFINGVLGDRIGARRLVGFGLLASAACCAAFGAVRSAALFVVLFGVNGLAQASGWPGTTRAMAEWTTPQNRGTVMAFWATCYQVGGIAATLLAGSLIVRFGWRSVFFVPALVMSAVALLVFLLLKPAPADPGEAGGPGRERRPSLPAERSAARRLVLANPVLWSYGASYFSIKFIRYALLFWLPYYFAKQLGYADDSAAYVSAAFEVGGIAGVIVIGITSDRVGGSRSRLAAIWLVALALLLALYALFASGSVLANVALLALVGAALFGPDSLISGAAAQDAGGRHAAATATGFVNGMGSLGAILEGVAVPWLTARYGWGALFPLLAALGALAAAALLPALRRRSVALPS